MKFFVCIIGITIILIASTAARVFEDKYGRIINAQLVSHSGPAADRIKINKGGKEMNVKVDVFSKKDQEFIRSWMKSTPPTLDYAFRIETAKKKQSEDKGDRITFNTTPSTLYNVSSRRYYGYSYKESLLGVILRIYGPGDKIIEEWRSPGIRMDKVAWDSADQPIEPIKRGFTDEIKERDIDALRNLLESSDNPFRTKKPDVVKSSK